MACSSGLGGFQPTTLVNRLSTYLNKKQTGTRAINKSSKASKQVVVVVSQLPNLSKSQKSWTYGSCMMNNTFLLD